MIALLFHESELKLRMSVNNKDIQMYLVYNLLIYLQWTVPINACLWNNRPWLLVVITYQSFLCIILNNPLKLASWVITSYLG